MMVMTVWMGMMIFFLSETLWMSGMRKTRAKRSGLPLRQKAIPGSTLQAPHHTDIWKTRIIRNTGSWMKRPHRLFAGFFRWQWTDMVLTRSQRSWKKIRWRSRQYTWQGMGQDYGREEWTRSKTPMRGVRRRWQGSWKSGNILVTLLISRPESILRTKRAIMCQKITGQYLRTRRKRSLIRKPLIMSRESGRMSADTRTDGEKHIHWQGWCIVPIAGQKCMCTG